MDAKTLTATTIRWSVVMQGIRWGIVTLALTMGFLIALPAVWAADGDAAADTYADVFKAIEDTKKTDPALADQMLKELVEIDPQASEQFRLAAERGTLGGDLGGNRGNFAGGNATTTGGETDPRLIGPPIEVGGSTTGGGLPGDVEQNSKFQEVQSDSRMQELHQQFEKGELTQEQAWEKTAEIMKDHGITPDQGREWGERGGSEQEGERGGFDRAWEQMSSEGREQLERQFGSEVGREGPSHEMERGTLERDFGHEVGTRDYEAPTHEYEAPTREVETREYEMPMREVETREYEAPVREYEAPEREYEAPAREYEAPTREYETPTHEYEAPTHEYEAPEPQ